jgi:putative Holliday junction resolvase
MRFVGVDFGERRVGLAVSDATGTLARPWQTIPAGSTPRASAVAVAARVTSLATDAIDPSDAVDSIVVGLPRRLGGETSAAGEAAREFALALGELTGLTVHLQDERLTSHAADELLAERDRDWRRRKAKLDAVAAAIILQDYLDQRARLRLAGDSRAPGQSW